MATDCNEFESILSKYEKQRINTYRILELYSSEFMTALVGAEEQQKKYANMLSCGTQLGFIQDTTGIYHLKQANFCRERICPMCQFRKSEKLFAEMLQVCELLKDKYRFLHLVLTVPNAKTSGELIDTIKLLYKGFNKFFKYKSIERAFKGCIRCLEISYNYNNDSFHPHLHCLIAVNKSYFNDSKSYLKYETLRELWSKACCSKELLQIYVRACDNDNYEGVAEVCKYSVKPLEWDSEASYIQNINILVTLSHALKGQRFVQKYGVIKDAFKVIKNHKTEDNNENNNTLYYNWDSSLQKYTNVNYMY